MGKLVRKIPFSISKQGESSLVDQMTKGLRAAILNGFYPVGSRLPKLADLARSCGVSIRIPKMAIKRMSEEGLVKTRRRGGTVVQPKGSITWNGHVLAVIPEDSMLSFFQNTIRTVLQQRLSLAGYFFHVVHLPAIAEDLWDTRPLDAVLRQHFDLAIIYCDNSTVRKKLICSRTPYFVHKIKAKQDPFQISVLSYDYADARRRFVAQCKRAKIKCAYEIGFTWDRFQIASALKKAGVMIRTIRIPKSHLPTETYLQDLMTASMRKMDQLIQTWDEIPDLLYFTDDFVATGALQAIAKHRIRVPEQVRVVSLANTGFLPFFQKTVNRFEVNPCKFGEIISAAALDYLSGKKTPKIIELPVRYNEAETFS